MKRQTGSIIAASCGAAIIVIGMAGKYLPVIHGHSVSEANGICTSTLGMLAQGWSPRIQADCGNVHGWDTATGLLIVLGVVIILCAAIGGLITAGLFQSATSPGE